MKPINLDDVREFVNNNIVRFHQQKLHTLENLSLHKLLRRKNPYLFRAKNLTVASDLVRDILDAYLSSSEDTYFGDFLEGLAIFIAVQTRNGQKSAATGIDLEFQHDGTHYIISIKSGPNWGNSSQQVRQEGNFKEAVKRLKQSNHTLNVQPVLGICYGKTKTSFLRGYMKVVGQNFWYFISENPDLYTDIIEPLGHRAREHNDSFNESKGQIVNLFTEEFMKDFCDDGIINWYKLVEFNSGNLDLNMGQPES
jgi:hypothetical protein